VNYFERTEFDIEVLFLLLICLLGLFNLIIVNDFIIFFIMFELYSLPLYILITSKTLSQQSTEAGLKYFIISAISSAILLFGLSLLYFATGTLNFDFLKQILLFKINDIFVYISLFSILSTLLLKLTIVPFHMWAPDIYTGAPLLITFFMLSIPKIALINILSVILQYIFLNYANI